MRYRGGRNVRFSENLECSVFLKHPFRDSPFCLITDEFVGHYKHLDNLLKEVYDLLYMLLEFFFLKSGFAFRRLVLYLRTKNSKMLYDSSGTYSERLLTIFTKISILDVGLRPTYVSDFAGVRLSGNLDFNSKLESACSLPNT